MPAEFKVSFAGRLELNYEILNLCNGKNSARRVLELHEGFSRYSICTKHKKCKTTV